MRIRMYNVGSGTGLFACVQKKQPAGISRSPSARDRRAATESGFDVIISVSST